MEAVDTQAARVVVGSMESEAPNLRHPCVHIEADPLAKVVPVIYVQSYINEWVLFLSLYLFCIFLIFGHVPCKLA